MYSPPIKYDDFLQKFPTEANAFQFYQKSCGIYCPSCGDKQFSYLRDDKPYMAYCKKCHKEFSILKDTIFVRKETDFRFWLYIGYLHYRMQTDMIIDRLNIAALQRDMQGTTYKSLCRINRKLAAGSMRQMLPTETIYSHRFTEYYRPVFCTYRDIFNDTPLKSEDFRGFFHM